MTTTVTGQFYTPAGDAAKGRVTFKVASTVYHAGLNAIFPPIPQTVVLGDGAFTVELEPTDAESWNADNVVYEVTERVSGAPPRTYWIDVPTTDSTLDLGELASYDDPPFVTYLTRWVDDPDIDALTERVDRFGVFNVREYGAAGDGSTDDTAALQAAIDAAHVDGGVVYLPPGEYVADQLTMKYGVWLRGSGYHSYGPSNTPVAQLIQAAGTDDDFIIFDKDAATEFIEQCQITDLVIRCQGGSVGSGICTRDADDNELILQDGCRFSGLMIRGFPEDGIKIWGSVPGTIDNIFTLFNDGYGISVRQSANENSFQMANLHHISLDGNTLGGVLIKDLAAYSSVNLWAVKSEQRSSQDYTADDANPHAVVIEDCEGTVNVNGLLHIRSGASTSKPGDAIVIQGISGNRPELRWSAAQVRVLDTQVVGDDPVMIRDDVSGTDTVSTVVHAGSYGTSPIRKDMALAGAAAEWHYGSTAQVVPGVADPAFTVGGNTPTYSLYEVDAGEDEKVWAIVASGGDLFIRAIKDDGTLGEIVLQFARTAGDVTLATLSSALNVAGGVGFHGTAAQAKPTVTGSRGSNAALTSLLSTLAGIGLLTDSTS